jgi:hypothetical protein
MTLTVSSRPVAAQEAARHPAWYAVGIVFLALLGIVPVLAGLHLAPRLDLLVVEVLVIAVGWWVMPVGALVSAVLSWMFVDAFIEDSGGVLGWHGGVDVARLLLFLGTAAAVSLARSARLRRSARRSALLVLHGAPAVHDDHLAGDVGRLG